MNPDILAFYWLGLIVKLSQICHKYFIGLICLFINVSLFLTCYVVVLLVFSPSGWFSIELDGIWETSFSNGVHFSRLRKGYNAEKSSALLPCFPVRFRYALPALYEKTFRLVFVSGSLASSRSTLKQSPNFQVDLECISS